LRLVFGIDADGDQLHAHSAKRLGILFKAG
jgi:hypothetical protein